VIDKMLLVKDKHGAGLYDCHHEERSHRDFRPISSRINRDHLWSPGGISPVSSCMLR